MRTLLIVVAALIAYGSLYPFSFDTREGNLHELAALFRTASLSNSRGDIVGNVLLFVPYGFFAALSSGREGARPRIAFLPIAFGLMLAPALQVMQIWIPGRVPALGDAVLNGFGLLLGYLVGIVSRGRLQTGAAGSTSTVLVPLGLMLLWVAYRWFPLVPTLDFQNMRGALKPLLVHPRVNVAAVLLNAVAWLPFFKLFDFTPLKDLPRLWLAAGAVAITLMQILFVGGRISVANVLGVSLAIAALPLLRHPRALPLACAALLVSLLAAGLQPFGIAAAPNDFRWLPFSGFLEGNMEGNAHNLVEKLYLYGSAIFLLWRNGTTITGASLAVALLLALVEGSQIMLVGRTPETTDPLLALLIGYAISRTSSKGRAGQDRRHSGSVRRNARVAV